MPVQISAFGVAAHDPQLALIAPASQLSVLSKFESAGTTNGSIINLLQSLGKSSTCSTLHIGGGLPLWPSIGVSAMSAVLALIRSTAVL